MINWLIEHGWWLSGASVILFLGGLVVGSTWLIAMPVNYFAADYPPSVFARSWHPVPRLAWRLGKNLVGVILLLVGIVMALPLVPGPGVLFILLGVSMLDLPGKRRLERYIITRPMVLRSINKLRARWNRPALVTHSTQEQERWRKLQRI